VRTRLSREIRPADKGGYSMVDKGGLAADTFFHFDSHAGREATQRSARKTINGRVICLRRANKRIACLCDVRWRTATSAADTRNDWVETRTQSRAGSDGAFSELASEPRVDGSSRMPLLGWPRSHTRIRALPRGAKTPDYRVLTATTLQENVADSDRRTDADDFRASHFRERELSKN